MKPSIFLALCAALGVAACSSDDSSDSTTSTGGSAGTGDSGTGAGGSAGTSGSSGGGAGSAILTGGAAGQAGGAGSAGQGGAGGSADAGIHDAAHDGAEACASLGPLVPPTVDNSIKAPAGATLVQRFRAVGSQIYTCKATGDAGGDGGGAAYAWSFKAPAATLYDDNCLPAATHFGGPTWKSNADGSTVVGAKVAGFASPTSIDWLLLKAASNTGEGIFSSVTAVQRVATVGGLTPTTPCNAATVGDAASVDQAVDYTAIYYFYTGGTWSTGSDAAVDSSSDAPTNSSDASTDSSTTPPADATVGDAAEGG